MNTRKIKLGLKNIVDGVLNREPNVEGATSIEEYRSILGDEATDRLISAGHTKVLAITEVTPEALERAAQLARDLGEDIEVGIL